PVNGFDLLGVEFVSGVVNEQRRERRDRDRGREIAGAADAWNRYAFYESLVARRVEFGAVNDHSVNRGRESSGQQRPQSTLSQADDAQARVRIPAFQIRDRSQNILRPIGGVSPVVGGEEFDLLGNLAAAGKAANDNHVVTGVVERFDQGMV